MKPILVSFPTLVYFFYFDLKQSAKYEIVRLINSIIETDGLNKFIYFLSVYIDGNNK